MEIVKVGISCAIGIVVGGYAEPHITPHLPASIASTKIGGLAVHAIIGGSTGALVFWVIRKVG